MIALGASDHFTLFRNRKDFISFVEEQRGLFSCPEEWEDFFGFALEIDDDGNETETVEQYANSKERGFATEPEQYPCIAYFNIGSNQDRFGKLNMRIFDWATVHIEE